MADDVLNLGDHDFLNPGYISISLGYMTSDKHGWSDYKKLFTGPSLVKLRACKFDKSTEITHGNDLLPVICAYDNPCPRRRRNIA